MLKRVIAFLKDFKDQKSGHREFEALKSSLSEDEIELIDLVFDIVSDVAYYSGDRTLGSVLDIIQNKDDKVKVAEFLAELILFVPNPFTLLKFLLVVRPRISPEAAQQALRNLREKAGMEDEGGIAPSEKSLEEIQEELERKINHYNDD